MTFQTDVRTDGQTNAEYYNIPAFSSKSAGITTVTVIKYYKIVNIPMRHVSG